jgi:hypothetical protein
MPFFGQDQYVRNLRYLLDPNAEDAGTDRLIISRIGRQPPLDRRGLDNRSIGRPQRNDLVDELLKVQVCGGRFRL